MEIDKFTIKLNRLNNNIYTIEEKVSVQNGKYIGTLEHDNINSNSVNIYTKSMLGGEKINNYTLSTPSKTPWKTEIELYTDINTVFISYETIGDTVEADDINLLQESIVKTQTEVNNISEFTNIEVSNLKAKDIELENSIDKKVANIINSAPETLDTLKELSEALGNDPNFATTVAKQIGLKSDRIYVDSELSKKSNEHNHPYLVNTYVPTWDIIKNKPIFHNIATSGDYNSLLNKPSIPIVDVTKNYVDAELSKKANSHNHPYRSDTWFPPNDHFHSNKNVIDGITSNNIYSWNNKSDFDGNYNNLIGKPSIPSKVSQLSNDSGYITVNDLDTSQNHIHTNMTALNTITSTNIADWNSKAPANHIHDKSNIKDMPTKLSQFEDDISAKQPTSFTWSMLRGN